MIDTFENIEFTYDSRKRKHPVIWLDHEKVMTEGTVKDVIQAYRQLRDSK